MMPICRWLRFDGPELSNKFYEFNGLQPWSHVDFLVLKWFLVPEVLSFLVEESSEDSSEVEVLIFLIIINLVWVDVFGEVIKDIDWVSSIGFQISFWKWGINDLFFEVEGNFVSSFFE